MNTRLFLPALLLAFSATATVSSAASFILNSPTVGPNQPGTFYVTGTVNVGAGESVLSTFTAGFNSNCGNFDSDFLNWNGTTAYTGKILDFKVDTGNLGYSGGMPVGIYNTNPLGPAGHPGVSLDWLDPNQHEHSMTANYHITVTATPEPASLAVFGIGAFALRMKRKRR